MATAAEKFDAAFINARKRGAKTFTHNGKKYSTETAMEEARKQLKQGDFNERPRSGNLPGYAKFVMDAQDGSKGYTLSRGANARANAYKQLRDEGKIDSSVMKYERGGSVRGAGMAIKGVRPCKMR